ncbi:hypothetical protein RND81_02G206000 [Saponaria officinalis]|uniref:Uncharacterized protein n=1 Tax=Saponaria officinalis TaxID=3572 RepID=A0AAW1MYG9_SAPOF
MEPKSLLLDLSRTQDTKLIEVTLTSTLHNSPFIKFPINGRNSLQISTHTTNSSSLSSNSLINSFKSLNFGHKKSRFSNWVFSCTSLPILPNEDDDTSSNPLAALLEIDGDVIGRV